MCIISVKTSRNHKHLQAIAALFLALPNVKLGAFSTFGIFCVGESKEGIKRILLAVR